jgi:hypothetical protein
MPGIALSKRLSLYDQSLPDNLRVLWGLEIPVRPISAIPNPRPGFSQVLGPEVPRALTQGNRYAKHIQSQIVSVDRVRTLKTNSLAKGS